jgi:capsule polysaccharide export protein KpsE/RkpR
MSMSARFIKLIVKWKIYFLIVTVAFVAIGFFVPTDYFIQAKYKSSAIVYPVNIIPYSSETPSQQLLQLIASSDIRDSIINKFKLAEHYHIDTTKESFQGELFYNYQSNIEVCQTPFSSVEIKVMDANPQMACDMVTEIIRDVNLKLKNLRKEKTKEVLTTVKSQLEIKKKQVDSVRSVLQELRSKYQLLDYEVQVKEVTRNYLQALSNNIRKQNLKDIDDMLRNLEEKGGQYYEMEKTFDIVLANYNTTKLEYDRALSDFNRDLSYTNVISKPFPTDKKLYPMHWIILTVVAVVGNVLLLVVVLLITIIRKPKPLPMNVEEKK